MPTPPLPATYFDGLQARPHPVTLDIADGALHIHGDGIARSVPLHGVRWPERTRHGMRVTHLADGGELHCADSAAWDRWYLYHGQSESLVVRLQQSWRGVLASLLAMVALLVAVQQWGLPLAAQASLLVLPQSVDVTLGDTTLLAVDQDMMRPSQLPRAEQARVQAAFAQAVAHLPPASVPDWQLVFRASHIGPNALALPGGTIIMTDEMVYLVGRDTDVLTAVLAHELGHVQHRDGVRMLVQVTLLGTVGSLVLGDFSTLLAGTTALLGQADYSCEAEHAADVAAVQLLQAARIDPATMVTLFDKLAEARKAKHADTSEHWLGIAFASHPNDAERVRFFQQAGKGH
ncbi:M48 family metallopeptidase [Rhodoferax sp.]|uniref:M48 family metallopeptidase n=1 Tax=Rhodoferax sp. TaxID=50421 RepID=UPI0025DB2191|nr:M48 family metallopeptidase [Rhodoferax sp.]